MQVVLSFKLALFLRTHLLSGPLLFIYWFSCVTLIVTFTSIITFSSFTSLTSLSLDDIANLATQMQNITSAYRILVMSLYGLVMVALLYKLISAKAKKSSNVWLIRTLIMRIGCNAASCKDKTIVEDPQLTPSSWRIPPVYSTNICLLRSVRLASHLGRCHGANFVRDVHRDGALGRGRLLYRIQQHVLAKRL